MIQVDERDIDNEISLEEIRMVGNPMALNLLMFDQLISHFVLHTLHHINFDELTVCQL